MSFGDTERIIAIAPDGVGALFPQLLSAYGEALADGGREVVTIGAFWDDAEHTRKRAASLEDGTIVGIALTDGRLAFRCLWQADLMAEFDANGLPGVEELSQSEFETLLPEMENQ